MYEYRRISSYRNRKNRNKQQIEARMINLNICNKTARICEIYK